MKSSSKFLLETLQTKTKMVNICPKKKCDENRLPFFELSDHFVHYCKIGRAGEKKEKQKGKKKTKVKC